jgi:hypothetical protein
MSVGGDLPSAMHHSSRRRRSEPLTATDAERLLASRGAHPEAPFAQHALASLLDNAAGPPTDQELAGEVAAVAAFMLITGHRGARHARSGNRFQVLPRRIRAMAATAGAGIVVAFSGAAVANGLPAPIRRLRAITTMPRPSGRDPRVDQHAVRRRATSIPPAAKRAESPPSPVGERARCMRRPSSGGPRGTRA